MAFSDDASKPISTTRLAETLHKEPRDLFQQLSEMGLMTNSAGKWELTDEGRRRGGQYREQAKIGRYVVWPASFKPDNRQPTGEQRQETVTATIIGKQFGMSAFRINALLSELGLIEKSSERWQVTNHGKTLGGQECQDKHSHGSYVRWPDKFIHNSMLVSAINEAKGESPTSLPNQPTTTNTDETDFRKKFEATHRAKDGHMVRSKAELLIDNWLYDASHVHAYERKLPVEEAVYSDFYLPKGKVYIEYWGYEEDPQYRTRRTRKVEIYRKYSFRLIELTDKDVQNLDDTLPMHLRQHGIATE